jgi:hypothetical protein
MRSANLANEATRQSEVGMVWEEKLSAAGSIEVAKFATFRVRAAAVCTVTIDGILAMTMASGEIALFNAGSGDPTSTKNTVTVTTSAASFTQVARDVPRKS